LRPRNLKLPTCLLILLASAAPGAAQTPLSLNEAVTAGLTNNPELQAIEHRLAASEGIRTQAGLRPNPTFTFQQENIRSGPEGLPYWSWTDTFAFVEQTIETGSKRKRRVEAAETSVAQVTLEREMVRKRIAGEIKQAYWAAAGSQRIYELLLEAAKNFTLTVQYHEVRVREGAMAEADLLRIRLESERLNLAASSAHLEAERARIFLFQTMAAADIPDEVVYDELTGPAGEPVTADAQQALANRTEMKLARHAVTQADADLRLQQAQRHPDVSALAGYKRAAGYNSLLAGVSVDLPLFNKNQGEIAAASSRMAARRSEAASMAAVVRAEVAAAQRGYEIRGKQISESLEPMLRQSAESAGIAQAAYREGGWDLLRLLDSERLRIEIETVYYRALAEFRQTAAELETAMGVEP
jgi:cobalt-zinc-cadmium efflux system outer membrane protein